MSADRGWTDTGYMGFLEVQMPNLDEMAANGLVFTRFHERNTLSGLMMSSTEYAFASSTPRGRVIGGAEEGNAGRALRDNSENAGNEGRGY
jgi:hypothetical protein